MKKIITDTNIWYSSTQEQIDEVCKTNRLVVPITVLSELYTSPNIYKSESTLNNLKIATKKILYNARFVDFIYYDPFEYLIKDILPELKPRLSVAYYLNEFEALKHLNYYELKEKHPERFNISSLTNHINTRSIFYKEKIDKDKKAFKKLNTRNFTIQFILKLANDNLQQINDTFPKIITLNEEYNLLIETLNELLREVSRSTQKLKDNDWIDIFNLTYVGKNDLYWTLEKSKIRLITNIGLDKYLFNYGSS